VEDVARAFEMILHKGVTGKIYNIGGTHEKANIEVARDLIRMLGFQEKEVGDMT
jgi:dTDP-D-glucose 4,6-dehydratase